MVAPKEVTDGRSLLTVIQRSWRGWATSRPQRTPRGSYRILFKPSITSMASDHAAIRGRTFAIQKHACHLSSERRRCPQKTDKWTIGIVGICNGRGNPI
jgi:hypothetical protein